MTCANCGAALKEEAGFCIQCAFPSYCRSTTTSQQFPRRLDGDPPPPPPVAEIPEPPVPKYSSAFLTTPQPVQISGEGYKISDGPAFRF